MNMNRETMACNICGNLWQFTDYIERAGISIHQYLLAGRVPLVFCTGTVAEAERNMPEIERILAGRSLKYILISHNESDEDGALGLFHEKFPEASVVCSAMTARELKGYGYEGNVIAAAPGLPLEAEGVSIQFVAYPSEVHMNDGLLFFEEHTRIFYSSDLFFSTGNTAGKVRKVSWDDAINDFGEARIPEPRRNALKASLKSVSPLFVAAGHGVCLDCSN